MRFLIVSHVLHRKVGDDFWAYGPYVKEMNLWLKHVDAVRILAPIDPYSAPDPIDLSYLHSNISLTRVPEFDLLTWSSRLIALISIPYIFLITFWEMARADHIHLRCPGNMGLIGCLVQIFFPWKTKTAKYAGNWDPGSHQPTTYRIQQKILSNEFWTKNIQVLVYGEWAPKSRNLLSFFTATYHEVDKIPVEPRSISVSEPLQLIFVGSLHPGKNPMISCEATRLLNLRGIPATLHLYGEGAERSNIEQFRIQNRLEEQIILYGNVNAATLKLAYAQSHFLVFASDTEGWPKAVAEAMFWACLPVTSAVSCVPQMIGYGDRGILVDKDPEQIAEVIASYTVRQGTYQSKCLQAMEWSRNYTLEMFETEIQKLLA